MRVLDIVEKPSAAEAPSNLAVMGRYVFTPEIFDALDRVAADDDGEIQLTDAIALLIDEQAVYGYCFAPAATTSARSSTTCGPPSRWRSTGKTWGPSSAAFLTEFVKDRGLV